MLSFTLYRLVKGIQIERDINYFEGGGGEIDYI